MQCFPRASRDHLITVVELAARLCVSRATVWRMVASGRLPPPRYPSWRTARWLVEECDLYLEAWVACPRGAARQRKAAPPKHEEVSRAAN